MDQGPGSERQRSLPAGSPAGGEWLHAGVVVIPIHGNGLGRGGPRCLRCGRPIEEELHMKDLLRIADLTSEDLRLLLLLSERGGRGSPSTA